MKVRDRQTGQIVDMPEDAAVAAHVSGAVDLPKNQQVAMVDRYGAPALVDADKVNQLASEGWQSTPDARARYDAADREARYGGAAAGVATFAAGTARTLTNSGSDVALGLAAGREGREYIRGAREEHPIADVAGEVTGAVVPALLAESPGMAGGLARATPAGMISRIGSGFERATSGALERMIGESPGLAGRVAQRVIPSAVGSAVEGAFYGAGQVVSESALGDHELNAESLLQGAGRGALIGGLFGAGASGAGAALSEGVGAARRGVESVASRIIRTSADDASAASRGEGGALLDFLNFATGRKADTMNDFLRQVSRDEALSSTGALTKEMRKLQGRPTDIQQRAADLMLTEAPRAVGKDSLATMSMAERFEGARAVTKRVVDDMTSAVRAADEAVTAAGTNAPAKAAIEVTRKLRDAAAKLDDVFGEAPGASTLRSQGDEVLNMLGRREVAPGRFEYRPTSIQQLRDARVKIDDLVDRDAFGKVTSTSKNRALAQVRTALEDEIEKTIGNVSQDLLTQYKAAKRDYQAVSWLNDATQRGMDSQLSNRKFGVSEQTGSIAGAVIGSGLGVVPSLATSAAGSAVSRLIKTRGDAFIAGVAHAMARDSVGVLSAIERTVTRSDSQLATRMAGYVKRLSEGVEPATRQARRAVARLPAATAPAPAQSRADTRKQYETRIASARAMMADPVKLASAVAHSTGSLSTVAPQTYSAVVQRVAIIAGLLAGQGPKPPVGTSLFGFRQQRHPTDSEIAQYKRAEDVIERGPEAIMDALDRRRLTPDMVATMKQVYPKSYDKLRGGLVEQMSSALATGKGLPPYEDRVQLGLLFEFPADETMRPDFITSIQQTYAAAEPQPPAAKNKPIKVASDSMTRTERLER